MSGIHPLSAVKFDARKKRFCSNLFSSIWDFIPETVLSAERRTEMENLAALIIRVRDGDAEAFSLVVQRFQDMAVGYSYSLLRDMSLAEDAAQAAFLEADLCLSNLREPAAFPGWFRRIVFKQCDRITRGRTAVFEPLQMSHELPSPHPNQAAVMEQREMKDQLWAAIDSLPDHERETVVLFYIGGYSQREVSEFL